MELLEHLLRKPVLGEEEKPDDQSEKMFPETSSADSSFKDASEDLIWRRKGSVTPPRTRPLKRRAENNAEGERPAKMAGIEAKLDAILSLMSTKHDLAAIEGKIAHGLSKVSGRVKEMEVTQEKIIAT